MLLALSLALSLSFFYVWGWLVVMASQLQWFGFRGIHEKKKTRGEKKAGYIHLEEPCSRVSIHFFSFSFYERVLYHRKRENISSRHFFFFSLFFLT